MKKFNLTKFALLLLFIDLIIISIHSFYWLKPYLGTVTHNYYSQNYNLMPNDILGKEDIVDNWPNYIDGTIEKVSFEVIGAPKTTLHHIVLTYKGKQDHVCPELPIRLMGTAKELNGITLPKGYGFEIKKGNDFLGDVHFYNPTANTYSNVKIKIDITIRKKSIFNFDKPVEPVWYDIRNCSLHPSVWIPPKTNKEFSIKPKIKINYDSFIVYSTAHFHDFAHELELKLDGKELQKFTSISNGEAIDSIEPYIFGGKNKILLKKGQTLDGSVKYVNTSDKFIDGMGLGVIFVTKK